MLIHTIFIMLLSGTPISDSTPTSDATTGTQTTAATPCVTARSESSRATELLFFSDIDGMIARPGCRKDVRHTAPEFLHLKQMIRERRVRSAEERRDPPLVVFGGSYIGPDPFGEYLFESMDGASKASALLDRTGAEVMALGPRDLESGSKRLANYVNALASRGRRLLATNVKADGLEFDRYVIVTRGGKRLLFLSLMSKDEAKFLPDSKGLSFQDPVAAFDEVVSAQKGRYDKIVVISHLDTPWTYPDNLLKLLGKIKTPPDLVLVGSVGKRMSGAAPVFMRVGDNTTVATTGRYGYSLTVVRLGERGIDATVEHATLKPLPITEIRYIDSMMDSFCAAHHFPIVRFDRSMDLDTFAQYLLGIMQVLTSSELAVVDRRNFMADRFPVQGEVTEEDVLRMLRSDPKVVVVKMKGSQVKALLGKNLSKDAPLIVRGLEKKGGKFLVNGRLLADNVSYRVAMTRFLAAGGGGWLPRLKESDRFGSLRETLLRWLSAQKGKSPGELPDMESKYTVYFISNTGASLTMTQVGNTEEYTDKGDLPQNDSKAVNVDVTVDAGIANAYNSFSIHLHVLYGKTWLEGGDSNETKDELKGSALYQWKGWAKGGSGGTWYPIPFVEMGGDSEITTSLPGDKRAYSVSGIAGIGLEPWRDRLFFKVGLGVRQSQDASGIDEYSTAYFGWQLTGGPVATLYGTPVKAESRLDGYFYEKDGNTWDVKATTKVYFVTSEALSFFLSHSLTAFRRSSIPWLYVSEFMVGLNVAWDGSRPIM